MLLLAVPTELAPRNRDIEQAQPCVTELNDVDESIRSADPDRRRRLDHRTSNSLGEPPSRVWRLLTTCRPIVDMRPASTKHAAANID